MEKRKKKKKSKTGRIYCEEKTWQANLKVSVNFKDDKQALALSRSSKIEEKIAEGTANAWEYTTEDETGDKNSEPI